MEYLNIVLSLFSPKNLLKITSSILFCLMGFFLLHWFLIPFDLTKLDIHEMNTLVESHALALLILLIMPLLFAADPLQFADSNKDQDAKFFQEQLPSRYLMQKFSLDKKRAESYWFGIFNKWADTSHPQHERHERTFEVGFTCRLIYFLKLWLPRFGLFAAMALLVNASIPRLQDNVPYEILYIAVIGVTFFWILTTHRPNISNPTGVWNRWEQINYLHKVWIDDNAPTLQDLQKLAS